MSSKIFNLDETGNSTVQVCPNLICVKGSKLEESVVNVTVIV